MWANGPLSMARGPGVPPGRSCWPGRGPPVTMGAARPRWQRAAPASHCLEAVCPGGCLLYEPGLPDAGFARHQQQRPPRRACGVQRGVNMRQHLRAGNKRKQDHNRKPPAKNPQCGRSDGFARSHSSRPSRHGGDAAACCTERIGWVRGMPVRGSLGQLSRGARRVQTAVTTWQAGTSRHPRTQLRPWPNRYAPARPRTRPRRQGRQRTHPGPGHRHPGRHIHPLEGLSRTSATRSMAAARSSSMAEAETRNPSPPRNRLTRDWSAPSSRVVVSSASRAVHGGAPGPGAGRHFSAAASACPWRGEALLFGWWRGPGPRGSGGPWLP